MVNPKPAKPYAPTTLTQPHVAKINEPASCGDLVVCPCDSAVGDDIDVMGIARHLAEVMTVEDARR